MKVVPPTIVGLQGMCHARLGLRFLKEEGQEAMKLWVLLLGNVEFAYFTSSSKRNMQEIQTNKRI